VGDNADDDDDNDGQTDDDETTCGSDPLDADSMSPDNDGDNSPDCVDPDDDNDGVSDVDEIAAGDDPLNARPEVAVANATVTVNEGEPAANSGTHSDAEGDAVTLNASVGIITDNDDGTWSWVYDSSDGPQQSRTVMVTAQDAGGSRQVTFELVVGNVAPTIESITVPADPVDVNAQPVSASATFDDPAGAHDEPYACTVDYDDDNGQQTGTVLWNGTLGAFTCTGPDHTYAEPGVYVVKVTVTDKDDGSDTLVAAEYIVIYDPAGGFVTGGGWIMSPEGACLLDWCEESTTGKANFGFVSKYKKGASTPTGQTEFQFKAGNLNFHSDSYDWLVIAGANAKYKGSGTVNGEGNYGFMLTATDAARTPSTDVDLFRIKIWDKDTGQVVYDNKPGQDDGSYDGTLIGGGNIKVHKK
jgi:hypothetical protein